MIGGVRRDEVLRHDGPVIDEPGPRAVRTAVHRPEATITPRGGSATGPVGPMITARRPRRARTAVARPQPVITSARGER
jgi:hypothetical protein